MNATKTCQKILPTPSPSLLTTWSAELKLSALKNTENFKRVTKISFFLIFRSFNNIYRVNQEPQLQLLESRIRPMCTRNPKTVRVCSPILHGTFAAQNATRSAQPSSLRKWPRRGSSPNRSRRTPAGATTKLKTGGIYSKKLSKYDHFLAI